MAIRALLAYGISQILKALAILYEIEKSHKCGLVTQPRRAGTIIIRAGQRASRR